MTWGSIPPEKRFKQLLVDGDREPASQAHFCGLDCGVRIEVGADMQFVRMSGAAGDYTVVHRHCWERLPERPDAQEPVEVDNVVYRTGQREKANGAVELLRQQGHDAWAEMLPDGQRHRDARYVVRVNGGAEAGQLRLT